MTNDISDEFLNSYIDDQLELDEKLQAFDHFRKEESMQAKVCELRAIKEAVQHAYQKPPFYINPVTQQQRSWPWRAPVRSLAACLLLLAGGFSGWFAHARVTKEYSQVMTAAPLTSQYTEVKSESRKIIVHISNSSSTKLKAALDDTEGLLDTYKRANRPIQVELIANKRGVDLMRSNVSIYEKRIQLLQQKYPNLQLMVCGQTINKLQKQGKSITLLPHTNIATSAANQINLRLQQGWGYIRI